MSCDARRCVTQSGAGHAVSRGRAACWLLLAGLAGHTVLGLLAALPRPRPRPWRGPALRVADPLEALGAPHELAGLRCLLGPGHLGRLRHWSGHHLPERHLAV